jgi:hypothetical protein
MYKQKYLKYRQKYLELKQKNNQNNQNNQKTIQLGGQILFPILMHFDQDRFEGWYKMKTNPLPDGENKNSFEVFLDLYKEIPLDQQDLIEPYNILVGAGCMNEPDYFRFKDSPTYSLYIDIYRQKEEAENQYHMYTINYDHINNNFMRFKANSINQIHFDTGVVYFAPIDYLELAEHVLIPGGKIIWDLMQHGGHIIFRRDGKFKKPDGSNYSELEMKEILDLHKVLIDNNGKKIVPIDEEFFNSNTICPQIRLNIAEFIGSNFVKYKLEPYNGFIEYLINRYSRLNFEKKSFTFANYTYPVPIRIYKDEQNDDNVKINVFNELVNFIVNLVMNLKERMDYIKTKKVSIEKIIQLCDRINRSDKLKENILEKSLIPIELLDVCKINDNPVEYNFSLILGELIWNEFNKNFEYIEAIKKIN